VPNFEGDDNSSDLHGDFPFSSKLPTKHNARGTQLLAAAIEGLTEFYPDVLHDPAILEDISQRVTVPDTGNNQLDYEHVRDQVEKDAKQAERHRMAKQDAAETRSELLAEAAAGEWQPGLSELRWDELVRVCMRSLQAEHPCLELRATQSWVRDQLCQPPPGTERSLAVAHVRGQIKAAVADYLSQQRGEPDGLAELRECHTVMLKTARRCARDLRHANDNISDPELRAMFLERIRLYETVFDDLRDYRLELHSVLDRLTAENAKLAEECLANTRIISRLRSQCEGADE